MKREGRQRGLVLTLEPTACPQSSPRRRRCRLLVDPSGFPPTTAFGTRVAAKPTIRSEHAGKATAGLRQQPSSKSRDKSKGARKSRDLDVGLNPRLASWRVVGGAAPCGRAALGGASASAVAVYLSGYPLDGRHFLHGKEKWLERDEDSEGGEEENEEFGGGSAVIEKEVEVEVEVEEGRDEEERTEEEEVDGGGVDDSFEEEDDDDMGFCEVWYVWDYVDEDDWCVVGEMEM